MSTTIEPDRVLESRGTTRAVDAFVVACAFNSSNSVAAFALGDGRIVLAPRDGGEWQDVAAHDGAVLSLASDHAGGFLSGGDDGLFARTSEAGAVSAIAEYSMKWVDSVASAGDGKTGAVACSVGKTVHIFSAASSPLKSLAHPSTVTGLAFDAKGKRIAASHYNGASLWFVASKSDNPRRLEWKGSHTGIVLSPDGDNVVTAMQENALHGWRLSDGQHMRMSGYPAKTLAMSFTRGGKWLATSGANSIVVWPFHGGGPMGKPPSEYAERETLCAFVACHPQHELVAAGYADGTVLFADIPSSRILPVTGGGRGPISALAWSPDGLSIAFGTEEGFAAVVDLGNR